MLTVEKIDALVLEPLSEKFLPNAARFHRDSVVFVYTGHNAMSVNRHVTYLKIFKHSQVSNSHSRALRSGQKLRSELGEDGGQRFFST